MTDGAPPPHASSLKDFDTVHVVVTRGKERHTFRFLKADNEVLWRRGLSRVTDPRLNGHDGMLFIFPEEMAAPFWMKDTRLPLSVAWIDARGVVRTSADMAPCADGKTATYRPSHPYRYAVEVLQGRLRRMGLSPGAVIGIACDGTAKEQRKTDMVFCASLSPFRWG